MGLLKKLFHKIRRSKNRYSYGVTSSRVDRLADRLGLSQNKGRKNERIKRSSSWWHKKDEKPAFKKGAKSLARPTWAALDTNDPSFAERLKKICFWVAGLSLGGAALFGLILGGLQLHRMATTSEFFAIKKITIGGIVHFKRDAVLDVAGLQEGKNSLTLNITDIENNIRKSPWVDEVAVKRRLPDAFEIRIKERAPVFWIRQQGILYYADKNGSVIAPVETKNFLSLPTLEVMSGGDILLPQLDELARAFQSAKLPVDMSGVSLFRLSAAKGFEVFIENRNLVLCIAAEDWDRNLRRLGEVLLDLARRGELKTAREVWASDGNVWAILHSSNF